MSGLPHSNERQATHKVLTEKLHNASLEFFDNPAIALLFARIQASKFEPEALRYFFVQRLLATSSFENLLRSIIKQSPSKKLASVVEDNLHNEIGWFEGAIDLSRSHKTWRHHFYHALGVSEEHISNTSPASGTRAYSNIIQQLIDENDAFKMAGALLFLEATIPREFRYLQSGRDTLFAENFVESPSDTQEEKDEKRKARQYLDDHIIHDATHHFPDLLRALETDTSSTTRVCEGITVAVNARIAFYTFMSQQLIGLHTSPR